jgi:tetratricopeptide (TPR) repeat protein
MPIEPRRLTVAMIVRDAEDLVAASLESVRRWADEILVADTGSIDRTRQLAMAGASRVIDVPWTDDFAAARNACLEQATGDWILWLDAGERIAPETAQAIRQFVDVAADPARVYMTLVELPPTGEHQMVEQVGRVRLMPNKPNLRFTGRLRENLRTALAATRMEIEPTTWRIQRSSVDLDPGVKAHRARRDLKLAELELADAKRAGSAPGPLPNLARGEAWYHLGDLSQAEECFRSAIALAPRGSTEMLEAYYGLLTLGEGHPSERDQQVKTCLEALEIFPFDGQLLCAMGGYMQSAGRLDLACRAYKAAVRHGQINLETWHVSAIGEVAVTCLSLALELLNEDNEARALLEEALAADGTSARLRRRLIDLHVKHDRRQEALDQAALLPSDTPHRDAMRSAIRGACLAAQKNWVAARAYLQTAYDAGCRDLLCLRWLGVTLFASNDLPAAEPVLRQWLAMAPGNVEVQKYLEATVARTRPTASHPANGSSAAAPAERRLRIDLPSGALQLNLLPERVDSPAAASLKSVGRG